MIYTQICEPWEYVKMNFHFALETLKPDLLFRDVTVMKYLGSCMQ